MDIVMPKMGESVSEGTIIKWHKKEGDSIERDEILFEISTDKVDTEVPAPESGTIKELKYEEGDTVDVGEVVAVLDEDGENGGESEEKAEAEAEEEKEDDKAKAKEKEKKEKEKEEKEEVEEDTPEPEVEISGDGEVVEIKMPKMGESVMEGTIIKWYKKTGEKVEKDETLFEISTDKVDTEVPSPEDGTLEEILVGEQETVEVGTPVAKLSLGEGKAAPKKEKKKEVKEEEKVEKKEDDKKEAEPKEVKKEKKDKSKASRFYSPLVMKIAQEEDVSMDELEEIEGSGLEDRVTKKDILKYIEDRKEGKVKKTEKKEDKPAEKKEEKPAAKKEEKAVSYGEMKPSESTDKVEKIPMDNIRQRIMDHMVNSRDTSVHVSAMLEVDMTKIHNFIQKKKEEYKEKEGVKLTYLPFVAYAVTKGLKEFPLINASLEENTIVRKKYINLGIAVAIEPNGLIVPNIKDADEKNIIGLTKSINDVAKRARTKKLSPDDISGGTFTITNYGVFGTIFGTPIINQPEVAILGVGTVSKKQVVVETEDGTDTIAIKPIMALTLSHDHRLVDGMLGGRFLKFLKDTLENFNTDMV